jgi:hypothetical protein
VSNGDDCDDSSASTSPAALEVCDGTDNDCDGTTDEAGAINESTWYADSDGDGYGNANDSVGACNGATGYVADATDCNDADAAVNPASIEVCDGVDNDCNGTADAADAVDAPTWYEDVDSDGYGSTSQTAISCNAVSGFVSNGGDCNDADAAVNPGALEVCDGVDNDCNGTADGADATDATTWYVDADGDGYGSTAPTLVACSQPTSYVGNSDDCNDVQASIHPAATEVCDGADNDCDGDTDDADATLDTTTQTTFYADIDGDGYGDLASTTDACSVPSGHVPDSTDCNDGVNAIHPGATEACDGADTDCDGTADNGVQGSAATCAAESCKVILDGSSSTGDGVYWIDPDSTGAVQTYCDMSTYSGGWTLVSRMTNGCATYDRGAVGALTSPSQSSCAKLSDAKINALRSSTGNGGVFWAWHDGGPYSLVAPKFLTITAGEFNAYDTDPSLYQQCSCSATGPFGPQYDYHSTMAGVYTHNGGWECNEPDSSNGCNSSNTNGSDLFLYQHPLRQNGTFPADSHGVGGGSSGYLFFR